MVQVTFMGTGAAFATDRRTNIALLVREGDTRLLVECGPAILYQLHRAGSRVDQVNYAFISHRHGDHILGLPMFLLLHSMSESESRPLTVLGSEHTLQAGRELARIVYPEMTGRLQNVAWRGLPPDQPSRIELTPSLTLSTLPVPHSPQVSVLALRLDLAESGRTLVYTGDTTYNPELAAFAAGCDLLVHESNFSRALQPEVVAKDYGHSTAHQAGLAAHQADCRILALVHLSPRYAGREDQVRAEAAQAFDGRIIVPNDGATLYL